MQHKAKAGDKAQLTGLLSVFESTFNAVMRPSVSFEQVLIRICVRPVR
jgi:hypothetical protein